MAHMIKETQHKRMVEAGQRRLGVYLDEKLYRDSKIQALKEGITLQQFVAVCLSERCIKSKKGAE